MTHGLYHKIDVYRLWLFQSLEWAPRLWTYHNASGFAVCAIGYSIRQATTQHDDNECIMQRTTHCCLSRRPCLLLAVARCAANSQNVLQMHNTIRASVLYLRRVEGLKVHTHYCGLRSRSLCASGVQR